MRGPATPAMSVEWGKIESVSADLDLALQWVQSTPAVPVGEDVVPGASDDERRMLAVLGGLVSAIVPAQERVGWPPDVLGWVNAGPQADKAVGAAALRAIRESPDKVLASIYARLVSGVNRRSLGTFFTPATEVELMRDMWSESEPDPSTVVDVGAGVGIFTATAAQRWPDARVFAVDINPVTLGLLALRAWVGGVKLHGDQSPDAGVRTVRADFTEWITQIHDTPPPRLILGNPPYTRSQLLTTADRARLSQAADGLCGSRASLSTLITAISLRHLEPTDGLSLLLPAQWLESQYAAPLREHLASLTHRRIELRLVDGRLFVDAQVDAIVLQVGPERDRAADFLVSTWTREDQAHVPRVVDRSEIGGGVSWRALFEGTRDISAPHLTVATPDDDTTPSGVAGAALADFCRLRRGTATGANEFFVLSEDEVVEHGLRDWTVPLIRRLFKLPDEIHRKDLDTLEASDKRWLLLAHADDRSLGNDLDRYLTQGEKDGVDHAYLCRVRPGEWFDLDHDLVVPDIVVGPMTRGSVRFVANRAGGAIVNNLYGWTWREDVPEADRTAILEWLRDAEGQREIDSAARRQGIGLKKLEPKALAQLRIPTTVAISPSSLM